MKSGTLRTSQVDSYYLIEILPKEDWTGYLTIVKQLNKHMKIGDVLILSLALALIVIGVHQSMTVGIGGSYPIFMFAVAMLFWFQLRRNKTNSTQNEPPANIKKKKKN